MKVLLVRSGGLGDSILTLCAAQKLTQDYPGCEIDLLGNDMMCAVAGLSNLFGNVFSLDRGNFHTLFTASASDTVIDLLSQYNLLLVFSSADPEIFQRHAEIGGVQKCRILDPRPPQDYTGHVAEYFTSILPCELTKMPSLPPLALPDVCDIQRGTVLIHPGSGGCGKNWPFENFIQTAKCLDREVMFLLGPAEVEGGMKREIESCGLRAVVPDSLLKLAGQITTGSFFIGNDSGVSHLAAWAGVSGIVLFGPTNDKLWRPMGDHISVVKSMSGDMTGISVEEVVDAYKAMI